MSIPPETPSPPDPNTPPAKIPPPARRPIPPAFIIAIVLFVIVLMVFGPLFDRTPEINYGFFREQLEKGNVATIDLQGMKITGEFKPDSNGEFPLDPTKTDRHGEPVRLEKKFTTTLPVLAGRDLDKLMLEKLSEKYKVTAPADSMYFLYLISMIGLPLLMLAAVFFMFRRTRDSIFGGRHSGLQQEPCAEVRTG